LSSIKLSFIEDKPSKMVYKGEKVLRTKLGKSQMNLIFGGQGSEYLIVIDIPK